MHQFSATRVLTGNVAPQVDQVIQKTKHYDTYLPDEHTLVSIKFGIDWYVDALERAGFNAHHVSFPDPHTGGANHWFLVVYTRSLWQRRGDHAALRFGPQRPPRRGQSGP
jgi:hypothetical protein